MDIAIAIPARFGSSRFPGKPLMKIGGQTMLSRVIDIANDTAEKFNAIQYININVFVTTEDKRIASHCEELGVPCFMTAESCKTGSDRVLAALRQMDEWPDFVLNLQGDAPFTPPDVLTQVIQAFVDDPKLEVITPVHRLGWEDLDRLREIKRTTPFSGTTAVVNAKGEALWFSKLILPAIRNINPEEPVSPVLQHFGVYGFRPDILEKFCALPQGHYEQLEGLEQLRLLENGFKIQTIEVKIEDGMAHTGIDTPEDLARAEEMLEDQSAA